VRINRSRADLFAEICDLAHVNLLLPSRSAIPYMNEPWYC